MVVVAVACTHSVGIVVADIAVVDIVVVVVGIAVAVGIVVAVAGIAVAVVDIAADQDEGHWGLLAVVAHIVKTTHAAQKA